MYVAQRGSLENPMIVTTNYLVYCYSVVINAERKKEKKIPPLPKTKRKKITSNSPHIPNTPRTPCSKLKSTQDVSHHHLPALASKSKIFYYIAQMGGVVKSFRRERLYKYPTPRYHNLLDCMYIIFAPRSNLG